MFYFINFFQIISRKMYINSSVRDYLIQFGGLFSY